MAAFRETAPTQWEYIAEGALNVALAYAGPDPTLIVSDSELNNSKDSRSLTLKTTIGICAAGT